MNKYIFNTNLQCSNCRAKVEPLLNKSQEVLDWDLDLEDPDRKLTVELAGGNPKNIIELVKKVGFNAELAESRK
ncbi:MAG: hypothetical protein GVX96_01165 [Bacteroidetes bacterium]|jgi:copper chaperone|nr:hypothetical protein [Bacteroidota bacterium]